MIERIKQIFETDNQAKIARETGVRLQTLNHVFAGRNKVSLEIISKIHYARPDISLNWLIFGEGEMHGEGTVQNNIQSISTKGIDDNTRSIIEQCAAKLSMVSENNALVIAQMQEMKCQNEKIIEVCNTLLKALR